MAPSEFFVTLQSGVSGGFSTTSDSSDSSAVITLTKSKYNDSIVIKSEKQKALSEGDNEQLLAELHDILKDLPTEDPPGSNDIYGENTTIFWGSEDLQWKNGGPSVGGGGKSEVQVQATQEQKEKFKRAAEIIKLLSA